MHPSGSLKCTICPIGGRNTGLGDRYLHAPATDQ